jgi:amidase
LFDAALSELESLGAELVEISEVESTEGFGAASYSVLLSEFHHAINEYLTSSAKAVEHRDLEALIAFNKESEREFAVFDQSIFEKSLAAPTFDGEEYNSNLALVRSATRENGIDKLLSEHDVSFLVAPSYNPAFKIDTVHGDDSPWGWIGIGWMAAIAGYPHVTVPMGTVKHLPVGVSFISGKWQDETVLQAAYAYEQASQKLVKPYVLLDENWAQRPASLLPANNTD